MPPRKPFVGGNWKMNTNRQTARSLVHEIVTALGAGVLDHVDAAVFPPFTYLITAALELQHHGSTIRLGAQDLYHRPDGAFTGEISAAMLHDCGATDVIVGHSERRHVIGETDETVNLKTRAALEAGLHCTLCVGETLDERKAGRTDQVNDRQVRAALGGVTPAQMERLTIAYEPVWAIGTGNTATPDDAQNAHAKIRAVVSELFGPEIAGSVRIQYGGSVKPDNAAAIFAQPDVDGGLIGGASLKATDFASILSAAAESAGAGAA